MISLAQIIFPQVSSVSPMAEQIFAAGRQISTHWGGWLSMVGEGLFPKPIDYKLTTKAAV